MGFKFYKYLENYKLVQIIQQIINVHDTLFIDGTNILGYFKENGCNSFNEIKKLIKMFIPRNFIYISMDGKSPSQKNQKHVSNRDQLDDDELNYIEEHYRYSYTELGNSIKREIIYDSREADGEAEHKIIKYILQLKSKNEWISNQKHYVISNDNDIIFLLLPFIEDDISVIKIYKNQNKEEFEYSIIDIKKVREHLLSTIIYSKIDSKYKFNTIKVMYDFIALSFFLGNDYIKPFKEIDDDYKMFDIIIESYHHLNSRPSSSYIYLTQGDSFDYQVLKSFIIKLSSKIEKFQKQRRKAPQIKFQSKKKPNENKCKNQKQNYNSIQKSEACILLNAFKWTFSYYVFGNQSNNYQYPEHNNITLNDFGNLIDIVIQKK